MFTVGSELVCNCDIIQCQKNVKEKKWKKDLEILENVITISKYKVRYILDTRCFMYFILFSYLIIVFFPNLLETIVKKYKILLRE